MTDQLKLKIKFIVPSLIGVLLFMIPVKFNNNWTVIVKIIADFISNVIGDFLPILSIAIILVSGFLTLIANTLKPKFITNNKILKDIFCTNLVWAFIRILGSIFALITFFELGGNNKILYMISSKDQGGFIFNDLIGTLVIINFIAAFFLPLLTDFGLLEYIGALCTKFMRPLFNVPGRAAVDCITSWVGDGTIGVMLTLGQYENGYYTAKEAAIISTLFSAVSITFSLVVLDQVGLLSMFGVYYLIICLVGIVCALICPRIWPLKNKPDTYLTKKNILDIDQKNKKDKYKNSHEYGMTLALKRVSKFTGIKSFLKNGTKNALGMWFGIIPTVMAIGTVTLIIANYTSLFQYFGVPFISLLKFLRVPYAEAAASTMIIGFADMFTPSILISSAHVSDMTKFIVAVISVTQVLYLSETGSLIIASKIPINFFELFIIFLERTIISLLIVCPIAHFLF